MAFAKLISPGALLTQHFNLEGAEPDPPPITMTPRTLTSLMNGTWTMSSGSSSLRKGSPSRLSLSSLG